MFRTWDQGVGRLYSKHLERPGTKQNTPETAEAIDAPTGFERNLLQMALDKLVDGWMEKQMQCLSMCLRFYLPTCQERLLSLQGAVIEPSLPNRALSGLQKPLNRAL